MPAWNDLLREFDSQPDDVAKAAWLERRQVESLAEIGRLRGGRNVLFYASAFLQKPYVPGSWVGLTHEEINGFMSTLYGMEWKRGLTLILHTPGGAINAAESVVSYLRSKFEDIEAIVPTYAMSAGTMIALSADRLVMGRQSQLGPIDAQLSVASDRFASARAIVEQFAMAKKEISRNGDAALLWSPILRALGPALLQEALFALAYGETMVAKWLASYMLKNRRDRLRAAKRIAKYFNDAAKHKSHGRRIDREEARAVGLLVEDLEDDQKLQEAVLTAYHVQTIAFEKSPASKMLSSGHGRMWVKSWTPPSGS